MPLRRGRGRLGSGRCELDLVLSVARLALHVAIVAA